ncbi:MAG: hypothetical protein ACXAB2_14100 [Candidatus Hodarchaeales archaeon]|jgi:hypothetical protein
MSRKLIEGLWNAEKAKLIAALPKVKIPLKQLIDKPEFLLNDGEVSAVASSDLELLCKIIPEPLWEEFMLPIIYISKTKTIISNPWRKNRSLGSRNSIGVNSCFSVFPRCLFPPKVFLCIPLSNSSEKNTHGYISNFCSGRKINTIQ